MRIRTRGELVVRTPLPHLGRAELEQIARALGVELVRIVRLRTRQGLDEAREPFKPYSREYARRRRLSGRSTDPKLQLTGQLMNGLSVLQVDGGRAFVGWGPKADTVARFRRLRTKQGKPTSRRAKGTERLTYTLQKTSETIPAVLKAHYVEARGRRFFGIENDADRRQLAEVAIRWIRRLSQRG